MIELYTTGSPFKVVATYHCTLEYTVSETFDYTAPIKVVATYHCYNPHDMSPLWKVFDREKLGDFKLANTTAVKNLAWVTKLLGEGQVDLDQTHPVKILKPVYEAYTPQGPWLIIHLRPSATRYWDKARQCNIFACQFGEISLLRKWLKNKRNLRGIAVLDQWSGK